jgi:hypothetical protein
MAIFHTRTRIDHADFRKKRKKSIKKLYAQKKNPALVSTKTLDPKKIFGDKYRRDNLAHIPSLGVTTHKSVEQPRYEGEMLERELAAQKEIERKKQCVAPAYNKGAYQYVGSEEQAKWIGKK